MGQWWQKKHNCLVHMYVHRSWVHKPHIHKSQVHKTGTGCTGVQESGSWVQRGSPGHSRWQWTGKAGSGRSTACLDSLCVREGAGLCPWHTVGRAAEAHEIRGSPTHHQLTLSPPLKSSQSLNSWLLEPAPPKQKLRTGTWDRGDEGCSDRLQAFIYKKQTGKALG